MQLAAAEGFSRRLTITWHLSHTVLTRKYSTSAEESSGDESASCCRNTGCYWCTADLLPLLPQRVFTAAAPPGTQSREAFQSYRSVTQKWTFSRMHKQCESCSFTWIITAVLATAEKLSPSKLLFLLSLFDPKMSIHLLERSWCQSEECVSSSPPRPDLCQCSGRHTWAHPAPWTIL